MLKNLLMCLLIVFSAPAMAIYKCESHGKLTYSDVPCPGGKAVKLDGMPSPDPESAKRAAQEKAQLKQIENERSKREAREEKDRQRAARANAAKQKKCVALARRKRWADEEAASASGKVKEKAKRKAQQIAEQFDADCGK